jgi:hypothetical protein
MAMRKMLVFLAALTLLTSCNFGGRKQRDENPVVSMLNISSSMLQSSLEAQGAAYSSDFGGFFKAYAKLAGGMLDMVELYGDVMAEAEANDRERQFRKPLRSQEPQVEDWDAVRDGFETLFQCTRLGIDFAERQQKRETERTESQYRCPRYR